VFLPYVFVSMEDSRSGSDEVHLAVSSDLGQSFQIAQVSQQGADVTEHHMAVEFGTVALVYQAGNQIFARVDGSAGAGILGGTTPELQVSATPSGGGSDKLFALDMRGDVLACAFEAAAGEDALLGYSLDGGQTWNERVVVSRSVDVDEPYCALTGNRDVLYSWVDNRACGSGNGCNGPFVSGLRFPEISVDAAGQTLNLDGALRSVGGNAAVFFTATPWTQGATPLRFGRLGFSPSFVPDALTASAGGIPVPVAIDAQGRAALPGFDSALLAALGGVSAVFITFDLSVPALREYSDPYKF
jgi:hypothetical protein